VVQLGLGPSPSEKKINLLETALMVEPFRLKPRPDLDMDKK
jgi:hypothetical protein